MWQRVRTSAYTLPALGYLALSLIVMAPVLPVFSVAILGGPIAEVDGWQNVWNLWWAHRALTTPTNPFFTNLLFYPQGVDLTLQTLNISNGVLFLPVTALFGPIAAYNAAVLTALVLSGIGGYALALRVSGDRLAAFIGGAVFAFSPFHLTKIWDGQLEMITLQWAAFYAFFLLRAVEELRLRDALVAGVFLALTGYTSWYYLFFFGIYGLFFAAIWLAGAARERRVPMLRQLVAVAGSGAALLMPLLIAVPRAASAMLAISDPWFNPANPLDRILIRSANLFDLFLPNGLHPLWGSAIEALVRTWHPYIGAWNVALGYTALALAAVALALARTRAWRWAVIGLAAIALSLGPVVQIGIMRTTIPLPYQILLAIPGMELARRPSHFVVIATLTLAPLVALGLRELSARVSLRSGNAVMGVAAALIAFEFAPPHWTTHSFSVHPYYARIAAEPGAVVELPPPFESSAPLKAQMIHGQPLVGGFVSRIPLYPFAEYAPGVRQLWRMRPDTTHLFVVPADDRLMELNAYGIRHIIVHWRQIPIERHSEAREALHQVVGDLPPVYVDQDISAYIVPLIDAAPFVYAAFGSGWHPEERHGERRWRWMGEEGEIILVNTSQLDMPVHLFLYLQAYQTRRQALILFDHQPLETLTIQPKASGIAVRLLAPPGEHRLLLRAPADRDPNVPGRTVSIAVFDARLFTLVQAEKR
ncbi:MAG: hypothetical protein NZ699_10740 [Roseiflexus sp.]|nr:hypothetical protein [Roseiflexus sp.]MCS7289594.1 hypothetical protein [Roseiflexus sp.]MDW8148616.1 hypothetical protein [Roseiflexaceae bacterium]MDW8231735.1 hypothetical protein [Roseiflexaceae bacterium]